MSNYTNFQCRKECDFYLRGVCKHGSNCSFAHFKKARIKITYDDRINKGYLIGRLLDDDGVNEVYIPGYKINEFYLNAGSIILDDHQDKCYEITLHPGGIHYVHKRYLVSTIIKRIDVPVNIQETTNETGKSKTELKQFTQERNMNTKTIQIPTKSTDDSLKKIKDYTYSKSHIDKMFNKQEQYLKQITELKNLILEKEEQYIQNITELKTELESLKRQNIALNTDIQQITQSKETDEEPLRRSKRIKTN